MTLPELKDLTGNAFAGPCYRMKDGEPVIVGKYCVCAYNGDDTWDVWLCSPDDVATGLTPQRLHAIAQYVEKSPGESGAYKPLTGEGVYTGMPTKILIRCASRLGIRRKPRPLNTSQRAALAAGRQQAGKAA